MLTPLDELTVGEVMSPGVKTIQADTPVAEVARLFLDRGFSGAPVVEESGRAIGVVTLRDLAACMRDDPATQLDRTAESIMTSRVLSVHDDLSIERAVRFMGAESVHRLFVTGPDRRLVGVLAASDVVNALGGGPDRAAGRSDVPRDAYGRRIARDLGDADSASAVGI